MFTFLSLGGAREIGANCYCISIDDKNIILDSGLHPKKKNIDALPNYNFIESKIIDALLISHSHLDHIGSLPYTLKKIPYLRPIMSYATYHLSEVMLHNSASLIMKEAGKDLGIYSNEIVDMAIQTFMPQKEKESFLIQPTNFNNKDSLTCTLFPAGHILGANSIFIKTKKLKVFYSGDINPENQYLIPAAELPEEQVDILILESTLCDTDETIFTSPKSLINNFGKNLNKIFTAGGSVLIPSFALGKTQEMLAILNELIINNTIPPIDIYTGSMGKEISKIYDQYRYSSSRNNKDLELRSIPQRSFSDKISNGDFLHKQSVILAPSGMVDYNTISYQIGKKFFRTKNNAIFFVGYLDPDSPGYQILQAEKKCPSFFEEENETTQIECIVKNFRFTSHAKKSNLLKIINRLSPKILILVHGALDDQINFKKEVQKTMKNLEIIIPEDGIEYKI